MDAGRFDVLTQRIGHAPSRRVVLRALGGALAALLGGPRETAAVCKSDKSKCKRNTQCCSGICQKKRRRKGKKAKKTCRVNREARGCTIEAQCGMFSFPCPLFPGGTCAVTAGGKGGKPFCATHQICADCESNAQCASALGQPSARCILCPGQCGALFNNRACAWFDPGPGGAIRAAGA